MGMIPPGKSQEELDRDAIALWKARRNSGKPTFPAARVHQLVLDLQRRFEEAGKADPKIVEELLVQMHGEAGR